MTENIAYVAIGTSDKNEPVAIRERNGHLNENELQRGVAIIEIVAYGDDCNAVIRVTGKKNDVEAVWKIAQVGYNTMREVLWSL